MSKRKKINKMKHECNTHLLEEAFVKIKQYNIIQNKIPWFDRSLQTFLNNVGYGGKGVL